MLRSAEGRASPGVSRQLAINHDESVFTRELDHDKAAVLLALHTGPGFVLPNAWDAGSARILEQIGFPAIATTSAGIAWSCGVPDGEALDRDTMLEHVARIVAMVGVPVTADLEAGYGDTPDDVGRTVARAVEIGAVGANLEDAAKSGLFGIDEAVDRIAAARAAAPSGSFVLNARTDTYFAATRGDVFAETVQRTERYLEAGADCVFVPGVVEQDTIRRLAAAIPGPLRTGELHRRAHALLSGRQACQPGRQLGPSHAQHAGARRPRAARLRNARLPRRRDGLRRPTATLRLVTSSSGVVTR
jgi:2-methylisocitrate lyase-like PEP mutase family enzyme